MLEIELVFQNVNISYYLNKSVLINLLYIETKYGVLTSSWRGGPHEQN